jgi:protein-S-isoprenylcysteine O-methyltransferase Ste14
VRDDVDLWLWGAGIGMAGFGLLFVNLLSSRRTRRAGRRAYWLAGWILNGAGMTVIGLGWLVLVMLPPRLSLAPLFVAGMAVTLAGAGLYVVSASRVGRLRRPSRYSLELETGGAYALVRHPQALALVLLASGLAGISGSVPFLASLPLWIFGWWLYARIEERLDLLPAFGARYEEYRKTTPFLIPRLFRRIRRSGTAEIGWRSAPSAGSRARSLRR